MLSPKQREGAYGVAIMLRIFMVAGCLLLIAAPSQAQDVLIQEEGRANGLVLFAFLGGIQAIARAANAWELTNVANAEPSNKSLVQAKVAAAFEGVGGLLQAATIAVSLAGSCATFRPASSRDQQKLFFAAAMMSAASGVLSLVNFALVSTAKTKVPEVKGAIVAQQVLAAIEYGMSMTVALGFGVLLHWARDGYQTIEERLQL